MALDRTGEHYEPKPPPLCGRPGCTGWLGEDDEGRRIPCLGCKPHLRKGTRNEVTDYAERMPSARAQEAIDRHNQEHA